MTHQIFIANRRRQPKSLQEEFGDIPVFDVTFAGGDPLFSTLSPMYPHGDLPVPYSGKTLTANSLEAIWQGLKVFEHEGARLDAASLGKSGDKNIKRPSTAKRGRVLGHQQGLYTDRPLLSLIDARSFIYAPLYRWQLQRHCQDALAQLNKALAQSDIVLLEAGNESNICDIFVPMVHSELLRLFLLGQYPECGEKHPWQPYTKAEHEADIERRKQAKKERIKQQKLLLKQQSLLLE
ncbi:MAG TPA: hypothetical protein H9850_02075 [Candidatus Anaerobiospirillum pullistercoris]|uniref:Uncharacterized protein n=1 Tax=Candidatus Anaerobiospirillum pullistercoris TaxID=2838452 RepID=A0A9D2B0S4_9GAMM|nr:hypothetical protein [Candidatus Anaerobiospirillum pullistercoris]